MATAVRTPSPTVDEVGAAARHRVTAVVFTLTSLLGSSLLFLVQPIVGRMLLPGAGGTVSLWNTAMVFFQGVLLIGYVVAHYGTSRLGVGRHRYLQLALLCLPLLVLPLSVPEGWALRDGENPILATLGVLTVMVGLPFLALATSSPTLQRWFAATDHPHAADPYFLYAAGNVGSLASLLGYPLVIERVFGLDAQRQLFVGLWIVLLALYVACAALVRGTSAGALSVGDVRSAPLTWARRRNWIVWAAVPSALLLATTRHLTTDIASFPLLWVLPLVLYLASFIVAFGRRDPAGVAAMSSRVVVIGAIPLALSFTGLAPLWILPVHLGWLFAAALLAHGRLSMDRPPADRLTEFYAWISLGGVLGGSFTALVAPVTFHRIWEYPVLVAIGVGLILPGQTRRTHPVWWAATVLAVAAGAVALDAGSRPLGMAALAAACLIAYEWRPPALASCLGVVMVVGVLAAPSGSVLLRERSFFGVYAVLEEADGTHVLQVGTTIHGTQLAGRPDQPTSYYHPAGPLGTVLAGDAAGRSIGIVGLGAGEIAAYGRPGDTMVFYEIDPVVADIALDPDLFTYLRDTEAAVEIVIGDGRLALEGRDDVYDTLVIDAFSSDAIPIHLLTREAFSSYADRLAPDGVLMVHVSNRHFHLDGVVGRIAASLGLEGRFAQYQPDPADADTGAKESWWVALSPSAAALERLDGDWAPLVADGPLWTDDYSDILGVLEF